MSEMYICVDVESRDLVHVYSTDEDCKVSKTFVSRPAMAERRSDEVTADPRAKAYAFAAYMARSYGCEWGSN